MLEQLPLVDVTVLGLVGGAPGGGDTARRRFIGGSRGPVGRRVDGVVMGCPGGGRRRRGYFYSTSTPRRDV